ncbi:MAG: hypothetical protein ACI8T1_000168 [Verrucomicrobiales bacterium]|jgi:hypothetical protein
MPMCLYRIPAFLLLIFVLPIVGQAQTNLLNEPSLEASDPSLEASDPSLEASDPSLEASDPSLEASEPSLEASEPSLEASEPSSKENLFMVLGGDAAQREWFGGSVLGCWMG